MSSITQIRVKGRLVGIVDLEEALEDARRENLDYEEAQKYLLERIRRKNYVPAGLEQEYGTVLARLYCERTGRALAESASEKSPFLTIRILGPGCATCERLQQEVMSALMELNLGADIIHVRDLKEIASYGVMGTPAMVINEQVVSVGSIPSRGRIKEMILKAVSPG